MNGSSTGSKSRVIGSVAKVVRDKIMSGRFLDITLDPVFKKALGRKGCEPRLTSLINTLLRLEGENVVVNVEIISQEEVPDNPEKKRALVDVRCIDQKGHQFIVEIQRDFDKSLEKRLQFYGARTYVNQLKKGEEHYLLKPVVVIVLVDYTLFKKKKSYLSYHYFLDIETYENDFKDISFCVFEMPKFREHPKCSKNVLESIWLDALANSKDKRDIPLNIPKEVAEFYHDIDGLCWSDAERDMLDKYLDEVRVYKSDVKYQFSQGEKKGLKKGMEKGHKEGIEKGRKEGIEKGRKEGIEKGRKEGIEKGRKEGVEKGRKEGIEKGRKEGVEKGRKEGIEKGRKEGVEKGRKEGIEKGRKEGVEKGRKEGVEKGRKEGVEKGRKEGIEKGRKEGIEKGKKEGILNIALKLKHKGYSLEEIIENTGLDKDDLEHLN